MNLKRNINYFVLMQALTIRKQLHGEVNTEVADSLINLSMIHLRKN